MKKITEINMFKNIRNQSIRIIDIVFDNITTKLLNKIRNLYKTIIGTINYKMYKQIMKIGTNLVKIIPIIDRNQDLVCKILEQKISEAVEEIKSKASIKKSELKVITKTLEDLESYAGTMFAEVIMNDDITNAIEEVGTEFNDIEQNIANEIEKI